MLIYQFIIMQGLTVPEFGSNRISTLLFLIKVHTLELNACKSVRRTNLTNKAP